MAWKNIAKRGKITTIFIAAILVLSAFLGLSLVQGASGPTFVLLIHGYSITGTEGSDQWQSGVNIYSQLLSRGYVVGEVAYYGTFKVTFSNGFSFVDSNFYGTSDTPIESIANELSIAINYLSSRYGYVNLDIIAHSMGGLITAYMLEHYRLPVNLKYVIYIASPFGGSPFASIASYLGLSIIVGNQVNEMYSGSSFLNSLQYYKYYLYYNYPYTKYIVYAGNYDPWWGYLFFSGDNDGVVSVASSANIYFNYGYVFNDLHTSFLDSFTWSGISYFEDQTVANYIIYNLSGGM
ncbi:MAG: esterase/lipase family protein [Thermoplasmata archaeon]